MIVRILQKKELEAYSNFCKNWICRVHTFMMLKWTNSLWYSSSSASILIQKPEFVYFRSVMFGLSSMQMVKNEWAQSN